MYTPLLSLLPSGRRLRCLLGTALGAALVLGSSTAQAQKLIYGLGTVSQTIPAGNVFFPNGAAIGAQGLASFDIASGRPISSALPISGITPGQILVGMDYRPNTGQLFALGYNASTSEARLYVLDPSTGAATAVGTSAIALLLGGASERIGFDFNPTVDRIRVVSTNDANYRLNPNTGGIAATDTNLNYAGGSPADPGVGSAAYTNSYIGSTSTTLYDVDELNGASLVRQDPPNTGTLNPGPALTTNSFSLSTSIAFDLDVAFEDNVSNVAYLSEVTPRNSYGTSSSNLYTVDLATGVTGNKVNLIPAVTANSSPSTSAPFDILDIAVPIAPPTRPALTGPLVYAVAAGNLISFDSNVPGTIRSAVNFGAGLAAGQAVVGTDFRPATAQLYALGYNAATNAAGIYTVNLATGALALVANTSTTLDLGGASERIGFDFNPTVDRIRVVSTNGANYRLNPNDGAVTKDINLDRTGISGAAYTNNQTNNNNTTVLYYYSAATSTLYASPSPNAGTLAAVGPSGLPASAEGADFDIYNVPGSVNNTAYLAVAPSGASDSFYTVNLLTGAATLVGQIGQGTNVTGLAVFIQSPSLLTWNGSVSTNWATAANWTPNQVPLSYNDVVISSGAPNQPTVTGAQQAHAVTLNSGVVLTLEGTLTVTANFTNNTSATASTCSGLAGAGTLALDGSTPQVIGGTARSCFPNLIVGASTATTGAAAIQRSLVLNGSLTVAPNQSFTLLSNNSGTAYVVNSNINGSAVVIGTATVQRYIDPKNSGLGYRHYSAPVANTTVADLAVPGLYTPVVNPAYNTVGNSVTPFPNVYGYDEARVNPSVAPGAGSPAPEFDKGFFSPNSTGDALEVTRGYTVNLTDQANVDFVGTLNSGPLTTGALARGGQAESGYHLRGNPYPSPLDWNLMRTNGRLLNLEDALYVFKSSGQYTGSYASYVNGVGANGGTNVLPVAQGFVVRTAAGQTGRIDFTNAERLTTPDNTPFQRGTADGRPQLTLALGNAKARTQVVMYFEQGATAAFDKAFDAHALPATNGLTLATETATAEPLAINGQSILTGAEVLVPLRVAALTAGTYTLAVDDLGNLPGNYRAYLRDALTGTYTDLATTSSVSVTLAANGTAGGRYAVLFTTQARLLAAAPAALARLATVYPNPAHGTATLLLPLTLRGNQATAVSVVDNVGRVVLSRTLAAGADETLELPVSGLAPGVYSVLARTAAGLVAKRLVVQ